MQAITCMHTPEPPSSRTTGTREKILAAAVRVFAKEGLDGATTRSIARAAKVNEVTLFRHFGSKDRLITAVIGKAFPNKATALPPESSDLKSDLIDFVHRYESQLTANLPMVRVCLSDIMRHREYEQQVVAAIFKPMRAALIERLERADLKPGITPSIAADLFSGMILSGVLRRHKPHSEIEYSNEQYRAAVTMAVLEGVCDASTR